MKRIVGILLGVLLLSSRAAATQIVVLSGGCGTGSPSTGQDIVYVDTTGNQCSSATLSGGTVTAATTATASATPTPVLAGTGKPLNESLFSGLFVEPEIGGTLVPAGHGTAAAAMRVELPTDGTGVVGLNAGSNLIGQAQNVPGTSGGLSITRQLVANNHTSVAVKASAGQLYGIEAFNNGTTIAYVKLYNAAQGSTTCGSGTPIYTGLIPAPASGGGGYVSMNTQGLAFATALTACVVTGYADNDATDPAATTYVINFLYK